MQSLLLYKVKPNRLIGLNLAGYCSFYIDLLSDFSKITFKESSQKSELNSKLYL